MLLSPTWAAIAGTAAILAIALSLGTKGMVRWSTVLLGTAVGTLAAWVAIKISFSAQTQTWSALLTDTVAASAVGMIGVIAMLPRHIKFAQDPVQAAVAALPAQLDPEVQHLARHCVALWNNNKTQMEADPSNRELLQSGVVTVLQTAAKEGLPMTGSDDELASRLSQMQSRIDGASDDETRTQYVAAKQAMIEQQEYRSKQRTQRDRLVAKLHHQVATLEKFQLAAQSSRAVKAPVVGRLADTNAESTATAAKIEDAAIIEQAKQEVDEVVAS
jgi:hypothetical protein